MDAKISALIRKYALQNAVKFGGKANSKSILGMIIKEFPDSKGDIQKLMKEIDSVVEKVNSLGKERQLKELSETAPEMLEKKEKEERNIFSSLRIPEGTKIKTAYPPGPEKYPHIGHAKAILLNYMLARQYNGSFLFRFEDTNPKLVKKEFYDIMLENFKWLGIEWDELQYASDFMELFYELAKKLIKEGQAYVCFCSSEKQRELRNKCEECEHRTQTPEQNLEFWKKMDTYKEGDASLRLKIDIAHENQTFRDPTIFRIIDQEHARQGKKYRIYPNYDFQNAVMDGYFSITHRIRGKEFELRAPLQRYIQKILGLTITQTTEFGRFNLEGVLASAGRVIREKVNSGELVGWDDPSLTTLVALRRRGFTPKAIKDFVLSTGISKADSTTTWDDLIMHNKRVLDKEAKRFFFIEEPVAVEVKNAPSKAVHLNHNPDEKKGEREFRTDDSFLLGKKDVEGFSKEGLVRLMDCINFRKEKNSFVFDSEDYLDYKDFKGEKSIIHWLAKDMDNVDVDVMMPDKRIINGLAEPGIKVLKEGEIIQFERFGFCRLDKKEKDKFVFWFTHK
ncbi:MAG: glutamate--tRNA ligase [Candidatus Woesearchaeota archaeon]